MAWTLAGIVRDHARAGGARPMLTYGARTITWAEMDARSSRVAQGLLAAGLAPPPPPPPPPPRGGGARPRPPGARWAGPPPPPGGPRGGGGGPPPPRTRAG